MMSRGEKKMVWAAYKGAEKGHQTGVAFPGLGYRIVFIKLERDEDVGRSFITGKLYAKNKPRGKNHDR